MLEPYGKKYALTDAILQDAQTASQKELFGLPEDNMKFANAIKYNLEKRGHIVHMKFTTRRETLKNVKKIVISNELLCRKHADNTSLDASKWKAFITKWKQDNHDLLINQLGPKGDAAKFLHGVFFTPSFAKQTVPELQRLVMADACHLNFGKYTLLSCYGVTANSNMSPVGFVIVFGNNNSSSWKEFGSL